MIQRIKFYPGTSTKITAPFYRVHCFGCNENYYSVHEVSCCYFCGCGNITCLQPEAHKALYGSDKLSKQDKKHAGKENAHESSND